MSKAEKKKDELVLNNKKDLAFFFVIVFRLQGVFGKAPGGATVIGGGQTIFPWELFLHINDVYPFRFFYF